jgi:predicted DNA-binding transcriptional regulator YafY
MNLKGRKFTWKITIESVKPNGEDWIITAWCHEQKDFLVFYASRIYQYFDLTQYREIKNIHEYLTARFGRKSRSKGA